MTVFCSITYILTLLTFVWAGYLSPDSNVIKLNFKSDMRQPNHLVNNILKKIENKEYSQLEKDEYELDLHCYECMIVKKPHMYHC